MKKSDLEVLSLVLLAAACAPDPDGQAVEPTSATVVDQAMPAPSDDPRANVQSAAPVSAPVVGNSKGDDMPHEAYGRTGRGGG